MCTGGLIKISTPVQLQLTYMWTCSCDLFTWCVGSNLVACVGFNEHKYSALEPNGLLTATLVLTGGSLLTSFNVTVIANVTSDISPSATGSYVVIFVCS